MTTSRNSKYLSIDALTSAARLSIGGVLPTETHQSLPIPVRTKNKLYVTFLLCPSVLRPNEGLWLITPTHRIDLDPETGEMVSLRKFNPQELGMTIEEGKTLGKYNMLPNNRTPDEYFDLQHRLAAAYEPLLEPYARAQTNPNTEMRNAAKEFNRVFPQVAEDPLVPFYRALGIDFFNWTNLVAQ